MILGRNNTRIIINPEIEKEISFTHEKLHNLQLNVGACQKTINKFANFLRFETSRKSAPSHYANYFSDKSKILNDIYKEKKKRQRKNDP